MFKKHWLYFRYLTKHKYYVFLESVRMGVPIRGIFHDWSKFLPDEWFPYVEYFHGDRDGLGVKERFDKAWLKHQHRNPHHWQYHVLQKDDGYRIAQPMKYVEVKEMVADWIGAGKAIHGKNDILSWYTNNRYNMLFHETTLKYVCNIINNIIREGT